MQNGIDDRIIVIKLSNDEELFDSLKNVIESQDIRSGIILSGIGMLKEFELGYFDPDGYKTRFFSEPHELISMNGSIAYAKNDTLNLILHIHCAVADRKHQVKGGHLNRAKVNVVNEITILKLIDLKLSRIKNDSTGLMELNIED